MTRSPGSSELGRAGVNVSTTVPEDNPLDTEDRGVHPLIRFSAQLLQLDFRGQALA
jgi:hypothetical protein